MRRTIYIKTYTNLNNFLNLSKRGKFLGNYSCCNLFYHNNVDFLTRTKVPNVLLSRSVIFQMPESSKSNGYKGTNKGTNVKPGKECNPEKLEVKHSLSRKDKLKKAVKEYGSTVIVFHVAISLISLGTSYTVVSMGLDVTAFFETLGIQSWFSNSNSAANAGSFAIAYAIHKLFAPLRITITLASVPFIVRYLRRIGFLKK